MTALRLLDLFCGAGGAAYGYMQTGFHVTGIDIKPQPRYCGQDFIQGDALEYLAAQGNEYDVIHASPPCQFFTQMRASWRTQGVNDGYVDLLTPTLTLLRQGRVPYVVENVVGAGSVMRMAVKLHGGMFGLQVYRPRLFESNVLLLAMPAAPVKAPVGVYDTRPNSAGEKRTRLNGNRKRRSVMRIARTLEEGQAAMGIDWMEWAELKEAIPPAYTEYIGRQLRRVLLARTLAETHP